MKKADIFKFVFIFCIILSFFDFVHAGVVSTNGIIELNVYEDENSVNLISPNNNGTSTTLTVEADSNSTELKFSIGNGTGVYHISLEGLDQYPGEDLCYVLTDESGKEVCLAAGIFDSQVQTITDFSEGGTGIDVLLFSDQVYTLKLSTRNATPGKSGTYVGSSTEPKKLKIKFDINTQANNNDVFQSTISSVEISERRGQPDPSLVEESKPEYESPTGNSNVIRRGKYKASNALQGIGQGISDYLINPLEETICELLLSLGDFLVSLLNSLVGEEVTVTALVYNHVDAVNPNFFDPTVSAKGIAAVTKPVISKWYSIFRTIAFAIYIAVLLMIGIHILLSSTGRATSKAKELLIEWAKGILYLVFVPYLMKFSLLINEAIVGMLSESAMIPEYTIGSVFGDPEEWSAEEIEYRSPEYVSKYTGAVAYGSEESSNAYMNKLSVYEQNFDLMRIMRAYAGATKKIIYVIIWYILIGQLITFIVLYYKRFFMIAFFIAAFPIVAIFNAISLARGRPGKEIGQWSGEFISNVFTQTIHAIIYTVITGVCVSVVREDMQSSATLNWVLIILAINFVTQGEKIIRKILKAITGGKTAGGIGEMSKNIKSRAGKARSDARRAINSFKG